MAKKLVGVIEKASDGGYGIYALENVIPVTGYGLTEEEAKKDFVEQIKEQADYYKEKKGSYPEWYEENLEVEYKYDMSAFFMSFPFINASELAKSLGINPSLMRSIRVDLQRQVTNRRT
jgi:hypothetical protein